MCSDIETPPNGRSGVGREYLQVIKINWHLCVPGYNTKPIKSLSYRY